MGEKNKEKWKSLKFMNLSKYKISNMGRIKHIRMEKILCINYKTYEKNGRRVQVKIVDDDKCRNNYHLHRLIALAFLPNPDNLPDVDHIDENKYNNKLSNLQWISKRNHAIKSTKARIKNGKIGGNGRKVKKIDAKTGKIIEVYDSLVEAAKYNNINSYTQIVNVCSGTNKLAGGFKWEYVSDEIDGEIWKKIKCVKHVDYSVSDSGRVRNNKSNNILKPHLDNGYYKVQLINTSKGIKRNMRVSRLVATAFIPNPNKYPVVDHINTIKTDNNLNNLRWTLVKQNNKITNKKLRKAGEMRGKIYQYDDNMTPIGIYKSTRDANKKTKCPVRGINNSIATGIRGGGYYWSRENKFGGIKCLLKIEKERGWIGNPLVKAAYPHYK